MDVIDEIDAVVREVRGEMRHDVTIAAFTCERARRTRAS